MLKGQDYQGWSLSEVTGYLEVNDQNTTRDEKVNRMLEFTADEIRNNFPEFHRLLLEEDYFTEAR